MIGILISLFIYSFSVSAKTVDDIYLIAKNNISTNTIIIEQKQYLAAGKNQFRSLWTRDFCFSTEGLLQAGFTKTVRDHLDFLLANPRKEDYLMPLYMDSQTPIIRVLAASLNHTFNTKLKLKDPYKLKPYYLINGLHPSIDSNILVLFAAMNYLKKTNDQEWYDKNKDIFNKIFSYYDSKIKNGLIYQGAHSDWQDSAKRKGYSFFTNILYYQVAEFYKFKSNIELDNLKKLIHDNFFDPKSGLYLSMLGEEYISLDGNLWAIEYNIFSNADLVYHNLLNSDLFKKFQLLGFATYPSYPSKELYTQVKISGLKEYHGSLYWSWLLNKSAKVAYMMNDFTFFKQQYEFLNGLYQKNNDIGEIYDPQKNFSPFKSKTYKSEENFSWGSATYLELYHYLYPEY